jgi:hypothetical protein
MSLEYGFSTKLCYNSATFTTKKERKMKQLSLIAASAIIGFSTLTYAQEAQCVGLSIGSTGADIEYSRLIAPEYNLALRLTAGNELQRGL